MKSFSKRWKLEVAMAAYLSLAMCCISCAPVPYKISGQRSFSYASENVGGIKVIYGPLTKEELRQQISEGTYSSTNRHNWLYLMIICPDVKAAKSQDSGSGINRDLMSNPSFYYEWKTDKGVARVSLDWNMRSDKISIGKQKFDRKDGNVFVIVREPDGKLNTRQCGTLGPQADRPEIVRHIRQRLPDDEFIKSLRYPRRSTKTGAD